MRNNVTVASALALARSEAIPGHREAQIDINAYHLLSSGWPYLQDLQGHALRRHALLQLLGSSASCAWSPHAAWDVLHDTYIWPPEPLGLERIPRKSLARSTGMRLACNIVGFLGQGNRQYNPM